MQTRLSSFLGRIIEGGWFAALIIVPILFNVYTERVFEEDKIPLMRSIALVMFVALIIWGIERGKTAFKGPDGRPWWKIPLVLPALVLAAVYIISTVFSIVPRISWWGAYIRRQGTYTWLSYITIFLGIVFLARDRKQVQRIITMILLISVPATLYAFLQNRGLDPLPWGGDVTRRVSSTAGNPIFISAYLIMVVPLTIMRILEHFQVLLQPEEENEEENESGSGPNYLASSFLAGAYLFLLIIQLMTIVYSQSRGPLLGLLVGLTFFAILASLPISRWLTFAFTGLAVAGIVFLLVFNLQNSPLEPLREVPYLGRLGTVFELDSGNGKVRALIWEGVIDLLAADPVRDIVGYGPESLYVAYNKHYPPELTSVEKRNASPDRSHNETFDALSMTGILGFAAQTFFFLSIFYYVLKWLGLINNKRQRRIYIGLLLTGGILGTILPYLVEGQWRLAGAGIPAGLTLSTIAYMLFYIVTNLKESEKSYHPNHLLLVALLSCVVAHFIEAHFGIAIGATRLYFWSYAALIVVVGLPLMRLEGEKDQQEVALATESVSTSKRKRGRRRKPNRISSTSSPFTNSIVLSLLMSLLLMVMVFNFYTIDMDISVNGYSMVWLFLATWFFGALVVAAESTFQEEKSVGWLQRIGIYIVITFVLSAIFVSIYVPSIQPKAFASQNITPDDLVNSITPIANAITILYLFTFLMIALITAVLMYKDRSSIYKTMNLPVWVPSAYGVLVVPIVIWMIINTNLDISRADTFNKQGSGYERSGQLDAAIVFYQTALEMQPHEDRYLLNIGRLYMEKARRITDDPQLRENFMDEARKTLENARAINPLNTDNTRNLSSLHRGWAQMSSTEEQREHHLALADNYYANATELSPFNAAIWNDWAVLKAERGQLNEALETLNHSIEIDPYWVNTYQIRSDVAVTLGEYELALENYDKLIELNPNEITGWSGKAYVLAQMGRTNEAINANIKVLDSFPNDYNAHKNLAILYQQTGDLELSRFAAQNALNVANDEQKPEIEGFLGQIELLIQQNVTSEEGDS